MNFTPRAFSLSVEQAGARRVVRVTGEVDLDSAPRLEARLLELANDGAESITVDMSETDFMDSTGLHALVAGVRAVREHGGDLTVRAPSRNAVRILTLSGLDTVVQVV